MTTRYPSLPSTNPFSDSALILGPSVPNPLRSDLTTTEISGDEIQDPERRLRVVKSILAGTTQLISFPGTSQYAAGGGASACGLASLNCAQCCLLSAAAAAVDGVDPEAFLVMLTSRQAVEVCVCLSV
jgi:hypothetical protein